MENTIEHHFQELNRSLREVIENRIKLFKVIMVEKLAKSLYMLLLLVLVLFFVSLMLVFASVALAGWLNHLLSNPYIGYLIVTGLYLMGLLLFLTLRKILLLNPITRMVFGIFMATESDYNEYDTTS